MAQQSTTGISFSLYDVVDDCEGEVACVRYCLALGILSLVTLTIDPFPKVFPGFFLAKGLFLLWTVTSGEQPET